VRARHRRDDEDAAFATRPHPPRGSFSRKREAGIAGGVSVALDGAGYCNAA